MSEARGFPAQSTARAALSVLAAMVVIALGAVPAQARLNLVATTPDLAAIATVVGGDQVVVTTLTKPTEDPHFVDARPSFIVKLNKADVLLEGGAELESGWLPPLLEGARNPRIVAGAPGRIAAGQGLALLEVPAALDRAKGDIHAAGNPHYLIDPLNAKAVAASLSDAFARLDAGSATAYRANAAAFGRQIDARLIEWQKQLAPFHGRSVVSYHNLWPYFARRFDLKFDLFLEPKPGIPPTPGHLADVIEQMKARKIRVIIVEPFQSRQTAERVAAAASGVVVNVTQYPGGVKGTEGGYLAMMDYLVTALAQALTETESKP